MSNTPDPKINSAHPVIYQIRIKGQLDSQWTDWFGGLTITLKEDGDTLLTGPVVDQAALHGLLRRVRDLGMPLVSVNPLEPGPATTPGQIRPVSQMSNRKLAWAVSVRQNQSK